MSFRKLTNEERLALERQGCSARSWDGILVAEGFDPSRVREVRFAGTVRLGRLRGEVTVEEGVTRESGVFRSSLEDCDIGDGAYVSEVRHLCRYAIGEGAALENVSRLSAEGESSFGNGLRIETLNEGGGRELILHDRLSSQEAYLSVMYKHDRKLTEALEGLAGRRAAALRSKRGSVGRLARITNTVRIVNVLVGDHAVIRDAQALEEGTVVSRREDPAWIGEGVVARGFIIMEGSKVDGGATLKNCLVGQGCLLGRQFSAENCAFFANCEGFHGEAVSLFAGPYTITHHKSTLLIGGALSFYNAGSGTNQSNHMYKLGPVHQGVLERGSKTGSFSYLLWPSRVGPFSVVLGKHYANFDTRDLPFSYITEEEGMSILSPAMNLITVGTKRDSAKWPSRDRRKAPYRLDLINFDLYSPFIVARLLRGSALLQELYEKASRKQDFVLFHGINIKRLMMRTCRKYYDMAVAVAVGGFAAGRLESPALPKTQAELRQRFAVENPDGTGEWVDVAGLLTPVAGLGRVLDEVKDGRVKSVEELRERLSGLHRAYAGLAASWFSELLLKRLSATAETLSAGQLLGVVKEWSEEAVKLNNMILKDAEKEFGQVSRIGFGVDGGEAERDADFAAVRGTFEKNKFVLELQQENAAIAARADRLTAALQALGG